MATSAPFNPIPIPSISPSPSSKLFFQLDLPGIPWYIYHDRFDRYQSGADLGLSGVTGTTSAVNFDLSFDPAGNRRLLLGSGGVRIHLPPAGSETKLDWMTLDRLSGWHRSPGPIGDFVECAGKNHPSDNYRSVFVDGEYKVEPAVGTEGGGWVIMVKVNSLIGEGEMDENTEKHGRNWVKGDYVEFQITVRRATRGFGWDVVGVEGVEVQEGVTEVVW